MVCLICHGLCATGEVGVKDRLGNCYHMYCMLVFYVLCLGSLAWDPQVMEQSRVVDTPSGVSSAESASKEPCATALSVFKEMFPDSSMEKPK